MSKIFVTQDGTWGFASDDKFLIIDISSWDDEDLDKFATWSDTDRWEFVESGENEMFTPTQMEEYGH